MTTTNINSSRIRSRYIIDKDVGDVPELACFQDFVDNYAELCEQVIAEHDTEVPRD